MALRARNVLSLCAGVGGLELGIALAMRCRGEDARGVCYVEREAAAAASLVASMDAGWLHPAPVWSDLLTFDARPWRGLVHILASGDPCQDNSVAGKRAGAEEERFLAPEVVRVARECRPDLIVRENVPGNAAEQLSALVPPLERLGYRVAAGIFSSAETGNTMRRERLFVLASAGHAERSGWLAPSPDDDRCGGAWIPQGDQLASRSGELARSVGHIEAGRLAASGEAHGGRALGQSGGSGGALVQPESLRSGEGGTEHAGQQRERAAAGARCAMGRPSSAEPQGQQRGQHLPEGWQVKGRPAALSGRAVLPPAVIPGPTDSRWVDVRDRFPELQPALSEEEAQSHLRRGIDAMAHRVERLRACGNGVDPVVAATAFLRLGALLAEAGAGSALVRSAA